MLNIQLVSCVPSDPHVQYMLVSNVAMQAVKWACRQPRFAALQSKWDLRHLAAAAGCCNIIALMTANLVSTLTLRRVTENLMPKDQ